MRRLSDQRGASSVIVAIVTTVLLGSVGLVIDVGAVYSERRELQNGADAAALALAADCATGIAGCATNAVADELLDRNASDGDSHLVGTQVDAAGGRVTVWARSKDASTGQLAVPMRFASILGYRRMVVRASATAGWGPPRSFPSRADGSTPPSLPLTIDACEFAHATDGGIVYGRPVVITFHTGGTSGAPQPCPTNGSGQDAPGNFGWVQPTHDCKAGTTEIGPIGGQTGTSPPGACSPGEVRKQVGKTVVLPIFDSAVGSGSHVTYTVGGWAAFHLTGFKLHGGSQWDHPSGNPPCSGGDRCIAGWFVRMNDARAPIGGKPYGIAVIGLTDTPTDAVAPEEPGDAPQGGGDPDTTETEHQEST